MSLEKDLVYALRNANEDTMETIIAELKKVRAERFEREAEGIETVSDYSKLNADQQMAVVQGEMIGISRKYTANPAFSSQRMLLIQSNFMEFKDIRVLINPKYRDSVAFMLLDPNIPQEIKDIENLNDFTDDQIYALLDVVEDGLPLSEFLDVNLTARDMDKKMNSSSVQKMNLI